VLFVVCDANEVYSPIPGSEYLCSQLGLGPNNRGAPVDMPPGCICDEGMFRDDSGACVPMEECGCTLGNGQVMPVSNP